MGKSKIFVIKKKIKYNETYATPKTHLANVFVTSGNDFHASQAIFFPRPQKDDTVSHPVNANQNSNPEQSSFLKLPK